MPPSPSPPTLPARNAGPAARRPPKRPSKPLGCHSEHTSGSNAAASTEPPLSTAMVPFCPAVSSLPSTSAWAQQMVSSYRRTLQRPPTALQPPPTPTTLHLALAEARTAALSAVAAPSPSLLPSEARAAFALRMVSSAKRSFERVQATTASATPIAPMPPPPPRPPPPPPELAEYQHLVARSASLFRLGHKAEGQMAMVAAQTLSARVPAILRYTPTAPPPASPRVYPPGQSFLNSLPDRAAPYRRGTHPPLPSSRAPLYLASPLPHPMPSSLSPAPPLDAYHPMSPLAPFLALPTPPTLPPPPPHYTAAVRRKYYKSCRAAARLAPLLSLSQVAQISDMPASAIVAQPTITTYHDIITTLSTWSAGYLLNAMSVRLRLTGFMLTRRPTYTLGDPVYGQDVVAFLTHVDRSARTHMLARNARHEARGGHVPDCPANGCTAENGARRGLRFLALKLHDNIAVTGVAVNRRAKNKGRRRGKPAASLSMRVTCNMEWHAKHAPTQFERAFAGAVACSAHLCLRFVNAQRARIKSRSLGVVRGVCELDAKLSESEQNPRPMWASLLGFLGLTSHWDAMAIGTADCPDEAVFFRGTDSPTDLSRATRWLSPAEDGFEMSRQTYLRCLVPLATSGPYSVPLIIARKLTTHSTKHLLANVGRARSEPEAAVNELGKWSGSLAQAATASAVVGPSGPPTSEPMGDAYSAEAADEVVPGIIERQVAGVRALVARLGGAEHLPHEGGWAMLQPLSHDSAAAAFREIARAAEAHGLGV